MGAAQQHLPRVHQVAVHGALVDHGRVRPHHRVVRVEWETLLLPMFRLEQIVDRALFVMEGVVSLHELFLIPALLQ